MMEENQSVSKSEVNKESHLWRFLIPSLIGVLMFLMPITFDGNITIGIGLLADSIKEGLSQVLVPFIAYLTFVAGTLTLLMSLISPRLEEGGYFNKVLAIFKVNWTWTWIRFAGGLFTLMTFHKVGVEWVFNAYTGGVILNELAPTIFIYLAVSVFFLPVLTDYGLMEFVGTFLQNVFQKVFRLPGRSAIDVLASWMGAGTVGVLITSIQYDRGYYTQREAATVATNFSIVSVAFCLVIAKFVNIEHLFIPYYISVCIAGVAAAIIVPRLPPLSGLPMTYHNNQRGDSHEGNESGGRFQIAMNRACKRAATAPKLSLQLKTACINVVDIWMGLFPAVMAIGTTALIINEFTPVFQIVSYPFIFILDLLQIPEAKAAAPAMIVGFADMFLPAVIGKGVESELTRFVIAGISVTQLIYMSEVGVLILKSNISLNLRQLFTVFILRTLVCLPIFAVLGHLFVG